MKGDAMSRRTVIIFTGLVTLMLFLPSFAAWKPPQEHTDITTNTTGFHDPGNKEKNYPAQQSQTEQPQQDQQTKEQNAPRPRTAPMPQRALDTPRPQKAQQNEKQKPGVNAQAPVSNKAVSDEEQRMIDLVNSYRVKNGAAPLAATAGLTSAARLKASDMIKLNYFSHTSPTYGSPFDLMKMQGITYGFAGENLAGAGTVEIAHKNLVNSPGHRENLLNRNYKKIGVGIVSGGPYGKMFVQLFTD